MMTPEEILNRYAAHPTLLADNFHNPLTFKEEFILNGLDDDFAKRINRILERALGSDAEIIVPSNERDLVWEMAGIRLAIRELIKQRGTFKNCTDGLN